MKTCTACGDHKKNSEFNTRTKSPDGLQAYCSLCNKNKLQQGRREFKENCVDYLGGSCWKCLGEFKLSVFDFHHLEPEHKDFEPSKMTYETWEQVTAELDKCALLCANCHREVHHED